MGRWVPLQRDTHNVVVVACKRRFRGSKIKLQPGSADLLNVILGVFSSWPLIHYRSTKSVVAMHIDLPCGSFCRIGGRLS